MAGYSRRERQILDILFKSNEASAAQIRDAMEDPPTDATVRTILRILVDKGAVAYRKEGKKFVYRPRKRKTNAGKSALQRVLNVFYDGSIQDAVVAHLTDPSTQLDDETIKGLRVLIEQAENRNSLKKKNASTKGNKQ